MTKVIAYTALHYGRDYLASAIRSVIDAVDEYHVIFTPIGSHGHRSAIRCPESREELYEIARQASGAKLYWHEGTWAFEGQQRDSIMQYAPDADVILVVDADEIWSTGLAEFAIREGTRHYPTIRRWRIPIIHYWRSFTRCVVHDPAFPERMIIPNAPNNNTVFVVDDHNSAFPRTQTQLLQMPIHHFGYAQRPEIVEYKLLTHGHRNEFRRDVDWFNDRFMANAQKDTHPVGSQYWNPEAVDPFALGLPEFMRSHPYAGMEVIE